MNFVFCFVQPGLNDPVFLLNNQCLSVWKTNDYLF